MALKFRRGTTAQKSGSLAFGEPYVNTSLGTLQIGGENGDITLGASGTGSTGTFGAISGSGLDITGNANIAGNLTLGGAITIGDATADTVNVVASLSSSLIPQTDNTFDLGSLTKAWRDLYISTGSIKMVSNGVVVQTLSNTANGFQVDQGIIANGNSSFGTSSAAITSVTGSFRVSGSASVIGALSASTLTGLGNVADYSTSVDSRLDALESFSSSLDTGFVTETELSNVSGAFATSVSASKAEYTSFSASAASNLSSVSGAFATSISASDAEYTSFSASAASNYALLNGNNVFTGTQTITGSLFVSANLIVQGSSSLQNITASAVSIGTNTVILNTDSPAVRWGGIQVIDSGSSTTTGSLFWDSANDVWVYVNPSGSGYASARLLSGPKSLTLGSEVALTNNKIVKVDDGDHLVDSTISDDGTSVSISTSLNVTNAISSSTINGIGNVTLYSTSVDSRLDVVEATASLYVGFSTSVDSRLDLLETTSSYLNTTFSTSVDSRLDTLEGKDIIINLGGDLSGSAQSTDLGTITLNAYVAADSVALGTDTTGNYVATITAGTGVSTTGATTGEGIAHTISIGQAVATSSDVRFNSIGVGMAASTTAGRIDAAGDVVAFSSSDKNFKENIKPIENPIDKIRKISGNTYDWKAELKDEHGYEGNDVGVIAQEIEEVLPQIVTTRDNGYKAVKYDRLVALLIEGMKEQQLQIESLRLEVEGLKKNNSL